jgi:DNA-binding response OmpR family regulator
MTAARTILVVDDDPMLRAGLQTLLQQHGYQTLEAEDGLEARDLIEDRGPDLVILDMMMPCWGGFAVLEHFQNRSNSPPFIMITANDGEMHRTYATKIGVADYLHKPFSFDLLLNKIDQLLVKSEVAAAEVRDPSVIRICCPRCKARIKAPVQLCWKKRPCPRCRFSLVIKPEGPADEGPMLVMDP